MEPNREGFTKFLRIGETLYLLLSILSFYLLLLSRTWEAHTVWEILHPAFIPTLCAATALLLTILPTSEKVTHKLLFVIVHSVLIHSFFSIVFPAGDNSGQQMYLGRIRLVYDNAVLHGWPPWPLESIAFQVYQWFRGINFQAALSVVFARMFSMDILWVHLFLVPVLWGVFTPIAVFLVTKTLSKNDTVAVLASLLLSAFPYATYFGAISTHNSLGYIFFFYALYFMLKNLDSNDSKTKFLMLAFSFLSLLSHYLTGIISFSLLFLTVAFKSYRAQKTSSLTARTSLAIPFILCTSLLPFSFIYLRFFRSGTHVAFTLSRFYELPFKEIVGLFLIGELTYYFDLEAIILMIIGPLLALLYIAYRLHKMRKTSSADFRTPFSFLFVAFLMILVDYRILKLLMEGLPIRAERLWVLRDFIAVPFAALAIYTAFSSLRAFLRAKSLPSITFSSLKSIFKPLSRRTFSQTKRSIINLSNHLFIALLFSLNLILPLLLAGWITVSLSVAYPQVAPLQTTNYELEAVKYIEENTQEKYVVVGDIWTIYAGERIVGLNNPRAYYFGELEKTGIDLFTNMKSDPSPEWMLLAMNYTDTTTAYFIVTEPRLGSEEFQSVISRALNNQQISVVGVFGAGKLYVFGYGKGEGV